MSMTKRVRRRLTRSGDDAGVAILTVLLVMAVLAALSTTVTVMTINNAQNSSRDRQAGSATTIADAGIAEAVNYLRGTAGAAQALACSPACTSNDWGSATAPHLVTVDTTRRYLVYFELVAPSTTTNHTTIYRVHSQGYAGAGPGARNVTVDLQYTQSASFPIGIFSKQYDAGGTADITTESVFSDGCVARRGNLNLTGTDPYYGVPAAVHSSGLITTTNGVCSSADNGNIHQSSICNSNAQYKGDQDMLGGTLSSGMACYRYAARQTVAAGQPGSYLETSAMTTTTLKTEYNYRNGGLTPQELDTLRAAAKAQDNYYTTASYTLPSSTTYPQAVLFFDLKGSAVGTEVDLSSLGGNPNSPGTSYARPTPLTTADAGCNDKQIFIVVLNGNARIQSNATFVTQLFVPSPGPTNGLLTLRGGAKIIGTVYADHIDQSGNSTYTLDDCFLKNLNGNQFSITLTNFREVDR